MNTSRLQSLPRTGRKHQEIYRTRSKTPRDVLHRYDHLFPKCSFRPYPQSTVALIRPLHTNAKKLSIMSIQKRLCCIHTHPRPQSATRASRASAAREHRPGHRHRLRRDILENQTAGAMRSQTAARRSTSCGRYGAPPLATSSGPGILLQDRPGDSCLLVDDALPSRRAAGCPSPTLVESAIPWPSSAPPAPRTVT